MRFCWHNLSRRTTTELSLVVLCTTVTWQWRHGHGGNTHHNVCKLERAAYRHQRDIMSQGIDITLSSKSSSSADESCLQFNSASSRCFPLPLTTQPLPPTPRCDVTATSSEPRAAWPADRATSPLLRPRPQRISLALTMRQLAPTSDDVTIGDVTRRDVSWRPCSVSLMASSIGNVRVSSSMMLS